MSEQDAIKPAANGPKWQHYVPCCYLKFFAHDGVWNNGRNSQVYFTDGKKSLCVPVKDVGADDYTYSKEFPEFDHNFNDMERDYPLITKKIMDAATLTKKEYYQFILIMGDFNIRNVAYENKTDQERKEVYQAMSRAFNEDLFGEVGGDGTNLQEMMDWFAEHWRLQPFRSNSGEKFITSDNPSKIFSHPRSGCPVMIYLPIHPDFAVVAFDKRHLQVVGKEISDDALGVLNGIQAHRCVRHVFSDHDILNGDDQESTEKLKNLLERKKPKRHFTRDGTWVRDFISTSESVFDRLTFIKKPGNRILGDAVRRAISDMDSNRNS